MLSNFSGLSISYAPDDALFKSVPTIQDCSPNLQGCPSQFRLQEITRRKIFCLFRALREFGSVRTRHACRARNARLKSSISQNPNPPQCLGLEFVHGAHDVALDRGQQHLKNLPVNPSGPGARSTGDCLIARSTSSLEKGSSRVSLSTCSRSSSSQLIA